MATSPFSPLTRTQSDRSKFLEEIGLHELALTGLHREQMEPLGDARHFRYNIATGHWNMIVVLPKDKPKDYIPVTDSCDLTHMRPDHVESDPFALSNQAMTPPVKYMIEDPCGNGRPLIRVFDNKYPLLQPIKETEDGQTNVVARFDASLHPQLSAVGTCEVIVEHWKFGTCQALMTHSEVCLVWQAIRDRSRAASLVKGVRYVLCLENHGIRSGGSLRHPHAQVYGMPYVPTRQRKRMRLAYEFHKRHGGCIFDHLCQHSTCEAGNRTIYADDHVVVFIPWSVERAYEMWVVPRAAGARIDDASDTSIHAVAKAVSYCLRLLYIQENDPDYNIIVRQAPVGPVGTPDEGWHETVVDEWYRWHAVIIPSTGSWGGVMVGDFIGTKAPEAMAKDLLDQCDKPLPMPSQLARVDIMKRQRYFMLLTIAGILAFGFNRLRKW